LGTDPSSAHVPGQTNVLVYSGLPYSGIVGDVEVFVGPTPGDVIRFNGNDTIIFYAAPGVGSNDNALATQFTPPVPPFPVPNTQIRILPTGATSLTYTPTAGQPGYDAGFLPTYDFIFTSGAASVPEPATIALMLLAATVLFIFRKLRSA